MEAKASSASVTWTAGRRNRHRGVRAVLAGLVVALVVLAGARPASAQYFGRNHVRYQLFHYRILTTPHFDIYYYEHEEAAARLAARMAERWYAIFARVFEHDPASRLPIVLYANRTDFRQTSVAPGDLVDDEGGVTGIVRRRIALSFDVTLRESDRAIGHELVHAFQFDMTRRHSWAGGAPGASRLPRWFIDGMAEYLSHGPVDPDTAMWVRDAVARQALPDLSDLGRPDFSPFRWGQAFWTYVAGRFGDEVLGDLVRTAGSSGDVRAALERELNMPVGHLIADWQQALRAHEEPILRATEPVAAYRRLLTGRGEARPGLSLSPVISPDGRRFLYLSRRSPLSVDLYLGDAETGASLRRLTSFSIDPRVSSLESTASAGSWAPDGRRAVLADQQHGRESSSSSTSTATGSRSGFRFPASARSSRRPGRPTGRRSPSRR